MSSVSNDLQVTVGELYQQLESCKNSFYLNLMKVFNSEDVNCVSDMDFISSQIVQIDKIRIQIEAIQDSILFHFNLGKYQLPFE